MNLMSRAQDWLFYVAVGSLFSVCAAVIAMSLLGGPNLLADENRARDSILAATVATGTAIPPTSDVLGAAAVTPIASSLPIAAATPAIVPPAQRVAQHVVQPGETLTSIATVYSVAVEQIMAANDLDRDVIYAGESLIVPRSGELPAGEPRPTQPLQWGK